MKINKKIKVKSEIIVYRLKHDDSKNIKVFVDDVDELRKENKLFATFIGSLKYAKGVSKND